jgi:hypothetical protein
VIPSRSCRSGTHESRLRRIAALLALLGVILYVYLTVVYDHFYSVLHVEPSDVGLSYATTLSRSSGLIATVVAIVAGIWFLLRWIGGSLVGVGVTVDMGLSPHAVFRCLPWWWACWCSG